MTNISQTDLARTSRAYRYITNNNGKVFVDGTTAFGSNTLVNAVIQVETNYNTVRAIAMINAIDRWGNSAASGNKVAIFVNTNSGSLTGSIDNYIDENLIEILAKEEKLKSIDDKSNNENINILKAGEIQSPSDGNNSNAGEGSPNWDALIDFAVTVGKDVYELVKVTLTGEYTLVNTLGITKMRAGDKLCVFIQNVDDQAEIYVDEHLIGARTFGEPGVWDYSEPLKPGKHMIMIVLKNSGRFNYSIYARICRASDYATGGSRKPILEMTRSGTDDLGAAKRVYYLKLEVH